MLTPSVILIFVTIVFLLSSLYLNWFRPTISFFIAIVVLVLGGILSPTEALMGFANEQLAVIVMLLIISDMFRKSSVVNVVFNKLFNAGQSIGKFKLSMMVAVASFSAFFNNTPLVAMMMPYVNSWSQEKGVSPSQLLIPLSYAAILGGCVTLIGTSTNLIVNGMAIELGLPALSIFDYTAVGLPMLLIGVAYLFFFGKKLLPHYEENKSEEKQSKREYFVETVIKRGSSLINSSVEGAGFRNLSGLYLVEVIRQSRSISPITPDFIFEEEDTLIFAGETDVVKEIKRTELGLTLPKVVERMVDKHSSTNEIVISYNSSLIGKVVKETDFRARFDAAIVAIHRNGERLSGKIGDMVLRAGDVLLVFSGTDFLARTKNNQAFYILTHKEKPEDASVVKVLAVFLALIAAIAVATFTSTPLIIGLGLVLLLGIMLKIMPSNEIRKGLDFDLIVLIAFGLAFGKGMINSGASLFLADTFLTLSAYFSPVFFLMFIFLVTNLLAAYITNKAAVAILFPISIAMAMELGVNPLPFILIVSFGAAANFITPIGYQTNLMVYGPGGYSFKDFLRIGWPLTIIYMVLSALILNYLYL
jgi:di/tricarboxylate transporter